MIGINIVKQIGTKPGGFLLRVDCSFKLQEMTRILGPSGVGKTTLLKMLAGLVTPDSGVIRFGSELWFDHQTRHLVKPQDRGVGFVFQDYALFPNMTVREHLQYGSQDDAYINRLLKIGELTLYSKRYPRSLSGGQQQRLAILRALSTKPRLLLMDEPFSALDDALKVRMRSSLMELFSEQGSTVLFISHQEKDFGEDPIAQFSILSPEV